MDCELSSATGELECREHFTSGQKEFTFTLDLVDPCQDAIIYIDPSIIESQITYGVYLENIAKTIHLDQRLVKAGEDLDLCPSIIFSITTDDGKQIDDEIFSFQEPNKLIIDTRDMSTVGQYDMKLHAKFEGDRYAQKAEIPFTVNMIEECADANVIDTGSGDVPSQFYYYNGIVEFKLDNPFVVQPIECRIVYTCEEERFNLCNVDTDDTKTSFNTQTGTLQFSSTDVEMYGTQEIIFKITGFAGPSSQTLTFHLNLVDPCSLSALSIDPSIIDTTITYPIYENNADLQVQLDPNKVIMTPASTLCPEIKLKVENDDGSPLESDIFQFNQVTNTFTISTQDSSDSDNYDLKVMAFFENERYPQMDEFLFSVQLLNFTNDPGLQYDSLEVVEVPARVQWPSVEEAYQQPQQDFVLSEIRYKQDKDYMELSGI